jgi:hypothetical protein
MRAILQIVIRVAKAIGPLIAPIVKAIRDRRNRRREVEP